MIAWALAALCLLFLTAVHLTAGEKEVARPLLQSQTLPGEVIGVLYLCWHVVTLVMVLAAAAFAAAAIRPALADFAISATIVMAMIALLSLIVVIWTGQRHRDMPQWIAFAVVAGLGVLGWLTV